MAPIGSPEHQKEVTRAADRVYIYIGIGSVFICVALWFLHTYFPQNWGSTKSAIGTAQPTELRK